MKKKILVVGLGLLGGSLLLALSKLKKYDLFAWNRNPKALDWAEETQLITSTNRNFKLEEMLHVADIIILALPIPVTCKFIENYKEFFNPNGVITDIGSTKQKFMNCAKKHLAPLNIQYIGSHPMAGTEKSKYQNALENLYDNANVFLTTDENSNLSSVEEIESIWQNLSCYCSQMEAKEHDQLVARTSHVAHILASALTISVLGDGNELDNFKGCASGFRDTSRTASSDPVMWREIIEENQEAILLAMEKFDVEYEKFRQMIKGSDFQGFENEFAKGRLLRHEWLNFIAEKKNV